MDVVSLSQFYSSSDPDCPIKSYGAVYNPNVAPDDTDQIPLNDLGAANDNVDLTTTVFFNQVTPSSIGIYPAIVGVWSPQVYGLTLGEQYSYKEFTITVTCGINS